MKPKRYRLVRYSHFLASCYTLDEARDVAKAACQNTPVKIHDDAEHGRLIETWQPPDREDTP